MLRSRSILVSCAAWALAVSPLLAQPSDDTLVLGQRLTIQSKALGEERILWVATPRGYESSKARYPVLYVLDPDVHFTHAVGLSGFQARYLRMPDVIVVGIVNAARARDFTPPPSSGDAPEEPSRRGGAERFMTFLTDEVRIRVEQEYRTEPFTILFGHSLGGLLTVHAFVHHPGAFDAHVALSPSLYWDESATVRAAKSVLGPKSERSGFLYVALSERERPAITTSTQELATVLEEGAPESLRWTLQDFPGENHITVPYLALHSAMKWLFEGWGAPPSGMARRIAEASSLAPLDDHFEGLSERYGYDVHPTEMALGMIGGTLSREGHGDEALAIARRRVALYPASTGAREQLERARQAAEN